ncbi:hypothetical protein EAG_03418 [Camponotus floridanus]|uniref:Uncharacterized protein n=1 Tax=Camponotus floridanus TaxID=104421 RepID=E2AQG8_CAMFO|nr:hypothetical protein EAG_03418 [Camponotus floridanus]
MSSRAPNFRSSTTSSPLSIRSLLDDYACQKEGCPDVNGSRDRPAPTELLPNGNPEDDHRAPAPAIVDEGRDIECPLAIDTLKWIAEATDNIEFCRYNSTNVK